MAAIGGDFYGASVADFSAIGGPRVADNAAAFPAIMNVSRVSGIWQNRYRLGHTDLRIYVALRGSIGTPTHIHLSFAQNHRFSLELDPRQPDDQCRRRRQSDYAHRSNRAGDLLQRQQ